MSQDPVTAVTAASADPAAMADRFQAATATANLQSLLQPAEIAPTSAMNLQSLANQFSTGLQRGFYAGDIDRLMHKLDQAHQPGSGVSFGDVTVELLNVQAKVGIADAFSKVSAKLSEGLQTMVVRQG